MKFENLNLIIKKSRDNRKSFKIILTKIKTDFMKTDDNMSYKISMIIPVFNVEKYLRKAIESVISQTIGFENIELILIDDKSTDKSREIIRQYSGRFANIKGIYLDECSGYPGKPRNIGLENATADYVMFLDSDDYLENTACERLYDTITEENADIVGGSYTTENKKGVRKINEWAWTITLTSPDLKKDIRKKKTKEILSQPDFKFIIEDLNETPTILGNSNIWCKIYKRSLIEDNKIVFPEDIVAQDSVFLLETFYNAKKIVFIKDIITHYNNKRNDTKDSSVSHLKSQKNLYGRIRAYDIMNDISKKHDRQDIFNYYLLGTKLDYWYEKYLLETSLSASELENLFLKYSHLFTAAYITDAGLGDNAKKTFGKIYENNIKGAVETVLGPHSEKESFLKKIFKYF